MTHIETIEIKDAISQTSSLDFMLKTLSRVIDEKLFAELTDAVYSREDTSSTFIGDAMAIPHGRVANLGNTYILAAISKNGIEWPTDDKVANLIFLIAMDKSCVSEYLAILQKILKWRKSLKRPIADLDASFLQTQLSNLL